MSDSQNMSDEVRARLRAIPSVNELLAEWPVVKAAGETCDAVVHAAVTAELDEERAAIRAGAAPRSKRDLASAIEWRAHRSALPSLRPAVNATGVVIHTNLGRAPLAESAAKAVAEVARGYSTLEYSVDTCSRGSRKEHAAQLIRSLTGAEDALVVNNNAAATLLDQDGDTLSTLEEYIAFTDPTNRASCFAAVESAGAASEASFVLSGTLTDRVYDVWVKTGAINSASAWRPQGFNLRGSGSHLTFTLTNTAPVLSVRFSAQR